MDRLLIVDDEEINRSILIAGFADLYETVEAYNGRETLDILENSKVNAVLLDLHMPDIDGLQVLKAMKASGQIARIPVFIVTASNEDEELLDAYNLGATDVIIKPYNLQFVRQRVSNIIELYNQRHHLEDMVAEKTQELVRQNNRLVEALANIVEFRSNESGLHVKRVREITVLLMKALVDEYDEFKGLKDDIESIAFAACLHDIGKIGIPDAVLNKPGRYTPDEFETMKTHTLKGYDEIREMKDLMDPRLYEYSLDIARHHHERYDGKGYPDHLVGEDISIWSQVVALADVYDALTSERCYKKAYDNETACNMIMNGECGQFNPKVIEMFRRNIESLNSLRLSITE